MHVVWNLLNRPRSKEVGFGRKEVEDAQNLGGNKRELDAVDRMVDG